MRALTENLGDLAGHDMIVDSQRIPQVFQRSSPRSRQNGRTSAIARWRRAILGALLKRKHRDASAR
jgi:hypothetical protein